MTTPGGRSNGAGIATGRASTRSRSRWSTIDLDRPDSGGLRTSVTSSPSASSTPSTASVTAAVEHILIRRSGSSRHFPHGGFRGNDADHTAANTTTVRDQPMLIGGEWVAALDGSWSDVRLPRPPGHRAGPGPGRRRGRRRPRGRGRPGRVPGVAGPALQGPAEGAAADRRRAGGTGRGTGAADRGRHRQRAAHPGPAGIADPGQPVPLLRRRRRRIQGHRAAGR